MTGEVGAKEVCPHCGSPIHGHVIPYNHTHRCQYCLKPIRWDGSMWVKDESLTHLW